MATGTTVHVDVLHKIGRDHLECSICRDRFKVPKVLQCQHSFCFECLVELHESRDKHAGKIPCPLCNQETELPETGIKGLQTNFHLSNLVDAFALLHVEEVATSGNTQVHVGIRPVQVTSEKDASLCQKHLGEENRLYCQSCQVLTCPTCTLEDHSEHDVIENTKVAAKYKQSLADITTQINRLEISLMDIAEAKVFNNDIMTARKEVQGRAADVIAKVIAKVKADEKRLLDEITIHEQNHKKILDEYEKSEKELLQRKQHSLEIAQDIRTNSSDCDFLSLYPVISKDLESFRSQFQHHVKVGPKLMHLRFMPSQTTDEINLGKLKVVQEETWKLHHEFGGEGSGPGEFQFARGIAAHPEAIAIADWFNGQVKICNNQGQTKSTIPIKAMDIAAIPNQWVTVQNQAKLGVNVYNKNNNTLAFEFSLLPWNRHDEIELSSVAVRKNGNILVGDIWRKVLTEHNPANGQLIRTLPLVRIQPWYLTVMDNDNIVISDLYKGQVDIADGNGATLHTIKPTIEGKPVVHCAGVCSNSSGIYVAIKMKTVNNGHIHHYDIEGTFISCVVQGLYNSHGMTFTWDGQLAVADMHTVKIYHNV